MKHMLAALTVGLVMSTAAFAHDMEKGPNGGPVADAAGHHVEFVDHGDDLSFFLSDEGGKPMESKGARGRAVVQDHGKTETVALTTADPNKLVGNLPEPLNAGARVVLSATMADGHTIQARFVKN